MSSFLRGFGTGAASRSAERIRTRQDENQRKREERFKLFQEQIVQYKQNESVRGKYREAVDIMENNFGVDRETAIAAVRSTGSTDISQIRAFIAENDFAPRKSMDSQISGATGASESGGGAPSEGGDTAKASTRITEPSSALVDPSSTPAPGTAPPTGKRAPTLVGDNSNFFRRAFGYKSEEEITNGAINDLASMYGAEPEDIRMWIDRSYDQTTGLTGGSVVTSSNGLSDIDLKLGLTATESAADIYKETGDPSAMYEMAYALSEAKKTGNSDLIFEAMKKAKINIPDSSGSGDIKTHQHWYIKKVQPLLDKMPDDWTPAEQFAHLPTAMQTTIRVNRDDIGQDVMLGIYKEAGRSNSVVANEFAKGAYGSGASKEEANAAAPIAPKVQVLSPANSREEAKSIIEEAQKTLPSGSQYQIVIQGETFMGTVQ